MSAAMRSATGDDPSTDVALAELRRQPSADTGNSGFFANAAAPLVLHPDLDEADHPTREVGSCAPFVWDEASVRSVWQRLLERATALGRPVPARVTTMDADLRLLTDQRTVNPVFSDSDRVIFVLPRAASEVRLVSRAQAPTEARPWLGDQRRLGTRVKRIVLRGADEVREVPLDHPDLTRGWWAVERDAPMMSRWTDGEAVQRDGRALPPETYGCPRQKSHWQQPRRDEGQEGNADYATVGASGRSRQGRGWRCAHCLRPTIFRLRRSRSGRSPI
jgi:hypothetical protein